MRMLDSLIPAAPPVIKVACPGCGRAMTHGQVVCTGCGYNMQTGRQLASPSIVKTSSAAPNAAMKWLLWPMYLFVRPSVFFRHYVDDAAPFVVAIFAWLYGMAGVIDRLDFRAAMANSSQQSLPDQWGVHWAIIALGGILAGAIYMAVGGWWYGVRLGWCGGDKSDTRLVRRVYLFASAVYAVPAVAVKLIHTASFDTPSATASSITILDFFVILCIFWSVWNSFIGVRTVFEARRGLVLLWLLIIPVAFYGFIIAGALVVGLLIGMATSQMPAQVSVEQRMDYRASHQVGFQYPGNWAIDTADPDHDAHGNISVVPVFQDAAVRLLVFEFDGAISEALDSTIDQWKTTVVRPTETAPFTQWGQYTGSGRTLRGTVEGNIYTIRVFVTKLKDRRVLEVHEVCAVDDDNALQPGFRLIQDTFNVWK